MSIHDRCDSNETPADFFADFLYSPAHYESQAPPAMLQGFVERFWTARDVRNGNNRFNIRMFRALDGQQFQPVIAAACTNLSKVKLLSVARLLDGFEGRHRSVPNWPKG